MESGVISEADKGHVVIDVDSIAQILRLLGRKVPGSILEQSFWIRVPSANVNSCGDYGPFNLWNGKARSNEAGFMGTIYIGPEKASFLSPVLQSEVSPACDSGF